jgi:hypothetical protein
MYIYEHQMYIQFIRCFIKIPLVKTRKKNYLEQRYTCIYLLGPEELDEVQYVSQQVCSKKPYPLDYPQGYSKTIL